MGKGRGELGGRHVSREGESYVKEREREREILTRERGGLRREGTRETRKGGRKGKGR